MSSYLSALPAASIIKAAITVLVFFLMAATDASSDAAELKLLSAAALRHTFSELLPQFERNTGYKVVVTYGSVGALTDRLKSGEAADIAIVSDTQIDELQRLGRIARGTRLDLAEVGVGVFQRKNEAKPNISSVDAFKRVVLAAKGIAYSDPAGGGPAGIHVARLMDRLGIAAEVKQRTKLFPPGPLQYQSVANGEADLGFEQISLILEQPIVELLGPLPPPIQNYTRFAAGIGAATDQAEVAKSLMFFLSSPAARARLTVNGFEPGTR